MERYRIVEGVVRFWLLASMVAGLAACGPTKRTQTDVLRDMNIDQRSFSALSACQQIRLYTDFGAKFLDMDHAVALIPVWMDDAIAAQPRPEIARCIASEGSYRLSLLSGQLSTLEDTSMYVHALAFKADELKLLSDPGIQSFIESAVCSHHLGDKMHLVWDAYLGKFTKLPPYFGESNGTERMRAELCKN